MAETILVPIHHKGIPGHWTIVGIYPYAKTIVHCDSFHQVSVATFKLLLGFMLSLSTARKEDFNVASWTLISPKDIEKQTDGSSCGDYAAVNA
eukprot:gene13114-14462_t